MAILNEMKNYMKFILSINENPLNDTRSVVCVIPFRQFESDVRAKMRSHDVRKANGPDGVPRMVLRNCAPKLAPLWTRLYRLSYSFVIVPDAWRQAFSEDGPPIRIIENREALLTPWVERKEGSHLIPIC